MSSNVEHRSEEKLTERVEIEIDEEEEEEEDQNKGRKLCKTLDALLADVDSNDNLYVAVRQCLHKVNRISRSSLPQQESPRSRASTGGVSEESSMGRFQTIKAFFDLNTAKQKRTTTFGTRQTTIDKVTDILGLRTLFSNDPKAESTKNGFDVNDNAISK
ncbi:uncharacterized protein LOC143345301 [Colletes latitarsis]|uniref:uncharacterized protein LOC143345301 n=1 Tax=Colletes latitarsis TaxID=2605962 RepID=UPI00403691B0